LSKTMVELCPLPFTRKTIDHIKQNRPIQIARDFGELGIPYGQTFEILLKRGLIKTKLVWKRKETMYQEALAIVRGRLKEAPNSQADIYALAYLRGALFMLQQCRADVRRLAHSDRWQAPDNDVHAQRWLAAQAELQDAS
jgi:hypothetical protein